MNDAFSLKDQVALVTGSTMGIGEATARTLAQAGAHVIVSSRKQPDCDRVAAELRAEGLSAEGVACHIGRMEDIAAMAEHLRSRHGRLDALVNNAVLSPLRSIADTDVGLFTKTVEVDLRGYWYLSAEAAKLMAGRGGSIVNVASILGERVAGGVAPYVISKSAVIQATKAMALELARHRIRVNALLPGYIVTDLNREFLQSEAGDKLRQRIPSRRFGELADLDGPLLLLASDAGAAMTGTTVAVDSGHLVSSL